MIEDLPLVLALVLCTFRSKKCDLSKNDGLILAEKYNFSIILFNREAKLHRLLGVLDYEIKI